MAVLGLAREGYRRRDASLADVRDLAAWPGFWRLAGQHWRTGLTELRGSLSTAAYMRVASRYVPEITAADVVRAGAGVRAQAVDRDGSLVDDFRIGQQVGVTTVQRPLPGGDVEPGHRRARRRPDGRLLSLLSRGAARRTLEEGAQREGRPWRRSSGG